MINKKAESDKLPNQILSQTSFEIRATIQRLVDGTDLKVFARLSLMFISKKDITRCPLLNAPAQRELGYSTTRRQNSVCHQRIIRAQREQLSCCWTRLQT